MKKILKIIVPLIALIGLSSCDLFTYYLPKPDDTNLELWITEKITSDKLENLTLVPGMFGGDVYLGSAYSIKEDGMLSPLPQIYVAYHITGYPDTTSQDKAVTRIEITDPEITFYGITLNSETKQIETAMKNEKFDVSYNEQGYLNASKKSVNFVFYKNSIRITATVTNSQNVQY